MTDIFILPLIHFYAVCRRWIMSSKKQILMNTALLTLSSLMLRMAGMIFQAWVASRIGAEGVGLYQLTGSVTVLFHVLAVSGIRFASTKLISEESVVTGGNVLGAVRCCTVYAILFGALSCSALMLLSQSLAFLWIGDARVVRSLRIAAYAAPFTALSAVFSGYFTSFGRIWKMVLAQLFSTGACAAITVFLLLHTNSLDLEMTCASITVGNVISEGLGFFILFLFYLHERSHRPLTHQKSSNLTHRMLSAALPLAFSSYTRTGLSTLEHMMIPKGLRLSGLTAEAALSGYGIVHGMALPAVLFPACLLFSLAELIVPELTRSKARNQPKRILHIIHVCRIGTLIYASATAATLYLLADFIAARIFHTPECAAVIRALAPLVPIMNLDTITDGCLRGLGKQSCVMAINILDAALGVLLVLLLLPRSGVNGYIQMIRITETANCLLSFWALQHTLRKNKAPGQWPKAL